MCPVTTNLFATLPPPIATVTTAKHHRNCVAPESFATLIDNTKSVTQLLQIHASLLRHNLQTRQLLNFKLQRSYSLLGRLDYSVALFHRTHGRDVFSYTAIIHAHATRSLHNQALHFYVQMLYESIDPNAFTFSAILKGCPLSLAKALHCQAIKLGCDFNTYVTTALVDVYARAGALEFARQLFDSLPEKSLVSLTTMMTGLAKHGDVDGARVLFDEMGERDVVCWNVMIDAYAQHGRPNDALFLFRQMLSANVRPDGVTLVAVFSACGQLGALESGRWVHAYIKIKKIRTNVHVGAALIDMYSKCGSVEEASLVFNEMNYKDVVAWNAMISGYAMNGLSVKALQHFSDMHQLGVAPTEITFIGTLSACAHAGLVDEGWKILNSMKREYGIEPKIEHYGCMINLLGRVGQLNEAFEVVRAMNINPDDIIWRTLLGACILHGKTELGEEILELHMDRGFQNSDTCILLSKKYAAEGNWNGVARVRAMMMKGSGIEKESGCSSIQVNDSVHEFIAGDMKHPQSKEIYRMLEEINGWLKAYNRSLLFLNDLSSTQ